MSRETTMHLTEQGLLRWQMGDASEAERAHVSACPQCQAQTRPMADALSWFGTAAREWGDEKAAATLQWRDATSSAAEEWRGARTAAARSWRTMAASWAVACVVLLLIFGIGLPRWNAHRQALEAAIQQQQRQQELARDNALMEEVDSDVSQVVPEAMQPLTVGSTAGETSSQPVRQ